MSRAPHLLVEHLGAGVVILRGQGTVENAGLLARAVHELRVKGTPLGPVGAAVAVTMTEAARTVLTTTTTPTGHADVPTTGGRARSSVVVGESLATVEASRLLGLSPRQVRRLDVGSWRVGGRLVHNRAAVEAEAARRAAATRARRTA